MALYVRQLSDEEQKILKRSLYCQNALTERRARILTWSSQRQKAPAIAQRLGIHVNTVRRCIKAFNLKGCRSLFPKPKLGRKKQFGEKVADEIIYFLHQPPSQCGIESKIWTLSDLKGIVETVGSVKSISNESIRRVLKRYGHFWEKAEGWIHSPDSKYLAKKNDGISG